MKIILMHGKDTDPTKKWYPWLREWSIDKGYDFRSPQLPSADDPVLSDWVKALSSESPDEDSILVGHSRGGVAILRWLEDASALRVGKVILLATNSGNVKNMHLPDETNHGFYNEMGYDFSEIRKKCDEFVVIHSKDDAWVPYSHGVENADGLGARLVSMDGYGHFGRGVESIPELVSELTS